jgi:glycosyltransferase involved in cell wall biosynthesis
MRVALSSWESLHSIKVGGVAVHVSELAAALQRRGHEVHVFTRLGAWQPLDECIDGVQYHRCPHQLNPNFVDEINNLCRAIVARFDDVQRVSGRFDVFHAHDWLAANSMVWVKEGWHPRSILTMHSTEYGRCGNNFGGGFSRRVMDHERHGTYCADHVIAVSEALKRELCWIYQLPAWKATVVYNGVSFRHFDGVVDQGQVKMRYGMGPFDPMMLFVGRLVYQKGPDLLLRAIPAVLRFHGSAKFVFAGDGDMRTSLERDAQRIGVAHACRFLGFKSGDELADLFRASDMVVVPSRNEPFGIVILEAWSAGKPVVASEKGGPAEFVWHEVNGLRVHATSDSVAWGVGTLLKDREHAAWMGRNGRAGVETAFTWDAVGERTEQVYRNGLTSFPM